MARTIAELSRLLKSDPGSLTPAELRFLRAESKAKAKKSQEKPPSRRAGRSKPRNLQSLLDVAWKQWQDATADIAKNGAVHTTETGYRYANPAVNQRKEAAAQIAKLQDLIAAEQKKSAKVGGVVARKR